MFGKVSLEVTEAQDVALEDVLVRMHILQLSREGE
jgi:hypothetical protein